MPEDAEFTKEDGLKNILHDAGNLQRDAMKDYDTQLAEAKEKAAEVFDKYMKVFAGADNTENITKDNIVAMQVSNSFKNVEDSSKFIKDYKILPIDDAEREKIEKFF